MNILKINQYFLKKEMSDQPARYMTKNKKIYLIEDARMVILPEKDFYVKLHEYPSNLTYLMDASKVAESYNEDDILVYEKDIIKDKLTLHIFKDNKGRSFYINKKLMDLFRDKYTEQLIVKDPQFHNCIYILENDNCIGVIMTMKM